MLVTSQRVWPIDFLTKMEKSWKIRLGETYSDKRDQKNMFYILSYIIHEIYQTRRVLRWFAENSGVTMPPSLRPVACQVITGRVPHEECMNVQQAWQPHVRVALRRSGDRVDAVPTPKMRFPGD